MKIKICGLSRREDIEYVNASMPDYVGFVFAKSKRQVSMAEAAKLKTNLDPNIKAVGVFVDGDIEEVANLLIYGIIDMAQLHGSEDNKYIMKLKELTGKKVIKAFRVRSEDDFEEVNASCADYVLLDAFSPSAAGGTGEQFNWSIIQNINKPFFLAGGINIENIQEAEEYVSPYAVDLSSSVEVNGYKDKNKICDIVKKVRQGGQRNV